MLSFQGETGPYIQYTYVRTKSVLDIIGNIPKFNEIAILFFVGSIPFPVYISNTFA